MIFLVNTQVKARIIPKKRRQEYTGLRLSALVSVYTVASAAFALLPIYHGLERTLNE
jgi:hypothetical protein